MFCCFVLFFFFKILPRNPTSCLGASENTDVVNVGLAVGSLFTFFSSFDCCCGTHSLLARHFNKCWHLLCRLVSTRWGKGQTTRRLLIRWESTTTPPPPPPPQTALPHHRVCVVLLKHTISADLLPNGPMALKPRASLMSSLVILQYSHPGPPCKEENSFSLSSYLCSTGTTHLRCSGVFKCLRFFWTVLASGQTPREKMQGL